MKLPNDEVMIIIHQQLMIQSLSPYCKEKVSKIYRGNCIKAKISDTGYDKLLL
jgi:hypothetical protein